MRNKIDWNLKFFMDVLGVESLHFGYWDTKQQVSIDELKFAQRRYTEVLLSKIPSGVRYILDVGCGTGEITRRLLSCGYIVEALSPDSYQQKIFIQKCPNVKFYLTKFEDLKTDKNYDLVLMAESCQYIDLNKMFVKLNEIITSQGYLLVADYFRRKNNISYYKTTHPIEKFYDVAKKNGFSLILDEDITENVLPTLILAKQLYERYVLPIIEILVGYFSERHPLIVKLLNFFLMLWFKKVKYYIYEHTKEKIDPEKFKNYIVYKIMLFKKI